jgi:hypothetical protein
MSQAAAYLAVEELADTPVTTAFPLPSTASRLGPLFHQKEGLSFHPP